MADFCTEVVGTSQVTLVGNSIGCIACLSAAALLQDTKGLVLINAAGNLEIEEEVRVASVSELAWLAGVARGSVAGTLGGRNGRCLDGRCLGGTDDHSDGGIRRMTLVS